MPAARTPLTGSCNSLPMPTLTPGPVHHYRGAAPALPASGDLITRLLAHARTRPRAPFLTTLEDNGDPVTLHFGEVELLTRRLASWLCSSLELSPGSVVGVIPRNDARSILGILSLLRAGCAILLLSPDDPPLRLAEQLATIPTRAVLRATEVPADLVVDALAIPDPTTLPDPLDDLPRVSVHAMTDALFIGTSGSTAASKMVAQTHLNIVSNAIAVSTHHRLRPGRPLLGCLPIHHVNGLHFTVFAPLYAGTQVLIAARFDPFHYPRLLESYRPRIASVVPSILEALLDVWRDRTTPPDLEYFVSAAAPLTTGTVSRLQRTIGVPVLQGYGLTETTNFATTMPTGLSAAHYRRLMTATDIPSIGIELPGNEVAVLRPDGTRSAPGEIGELGMRGHNVMSRYAGNPAATDEAFRHGWFHSGDLGYETTVGERRFFVITGRRKNIAKVGGHAVSLEEMERILAALPGVIDVACARVPHRLLGEEVVVAVSQSIPDGLSEALAVHFPAAVIPRRVVALPEIPRTPTGKLRRQELASILADNGLVAPPGTSGVAP